MKLSKYNDSFSCRILFVNCEFVMSPKLIFRKKIRQRDGIVLQDLFNAITLDVKPQRMTKSQQHVLNSSEYNVSCTYRYIDTDIWFNIAAHINPEDVCNFALICRQTAFIVSLSKFWTNLYRRFYSNDNKLPENLDARCLNHNGSLRSKVIRALFYMYNPLVNRIKIGYDLINVNGLKYVNSWHKKESNVWIFCYKLWNYAVTRSPRENLDESDSDEDGLSKALSKLNNVFENPHEGIFLLVICSKRFIPFPSFHESDMRLCSTRQLLASDLKSTNLELTFKSSRNMSSIPVRIIYPSASKYKVVPWWHPEYELFLYDEKYKSNCV